MDAFRFDIMGHMMVSTMKAAQAALAALTPARDGVDGSALYLYGEAWDFGEARAPCQTLHALNHRLLFFAVVLPRGAAEHSEVMSAWGSLPDQPGAFALCSKSY